MSNWATQITLAVISGGVGMALVMWARERWRGRQPAVVESANLAATAQALATVVAARDELEADNARLRQQLLDERDYYRAELDRLRAQLVTALSEVDSLRSGIGTTAG
jgi:hypothetical protein